jgi:hypothetical protein
MKTAILKLDSSFRTLSDQANRAMAGLYYYISPQTAHEWLTWRRSLHQFAQLVFQDNPVQAAAALKAAEPAAE